MKVVTAEEMRDIDRKAIKKYGIPSAVLMERAGLAVALRIKDLFKPHKTIVLSGGGNNGGDGIAIARNLYNWGWNVKVLLLAKQDRLSKDCLAQYKIARNSGVPVEFTTKITDKDVHGALLVDAIFGTGLSKDIKGEAAEIISFLNSSEAKVVSVDIPSGISSDNGQIMGEAVMADYTVTFGFPKLGHLLYPGAEYTGKLFVEDIGFPKDLLTSEKLNTELIEKEQVSLLLPERQKYSHKGNYGHVLVVAGSKGKTGAALMCAKACFRAGAGLVTIGVPESIVNTFQSRVTEEMILPLPDKGNGTLAANASEKIMDFLNEKADVLAIGPGLSLTDDIRAILKSIVLRSTAPMVIDADGINALIGAGDVFKRAKAPIILTPHSGEMARLLQKTVQSLKLKVKSSEKLKTQNSELITMIEKDRVNTAITFAKRAGIYLVLKGVPTIISEPEGRAFINPTGNPGMATAGVGDVLTGMIAGLLGQGFNPLQASILGVYIHGFAGDKASAKVGEHSLIASDIIREIPSALKTLTYK